MSKSDEKRKTRSASRIFLFGGGNWIRGTWEMDKNARISVSFLLQSLFLRESEFRKIKDFKISHLLLLAISSLLIRL